MGACIGPRGARVGGIVDELGGEKIDIVEYSDEPEKFIAAALSPAKVLSVEVDPEGAKSCRVTVPDAQLSLAIGNKGQNARLAAKLTGWKIDIRPESGFYGKTKNNTRPRVSKARVPPGRSETMARDKKAPLRKCTGCGEMKPKKELGPGGQKPGGRDFPRPDRPQAGPRRLCLSPRRLPETGPQSETVGKSLFLSDSRRGVRSHGGGIRGK